MMKTYELRPPTILKRFPAFRKRVLAALELASVADPVPKPVVLLGGDLEKAGVCLAGAIGLQEPLSLATMSRDETCALVRELVALGTEVHVSMEACGFGWVFPTDLRTAGATSVVVLATEPLTGKRKTNQRDALALCRVLAARVVHGDKKAGRAVYEPTFEQQTRRALVRQRDQYVGLREKQVNHGRALLYDFGIFDVHLLWWGKRLWPKMQELLKGYGTRGQFLMEQLAGMQEVIQGIHEQVLALDKKIEGISEQVIKIALPKGLGELSATKTILELSDPHRFKNRKQVGSYVGCAVSEYSTGTGQVLEGIDKIGNQRLRSCLTEAVWRMTRWEPNWRGFIKWGHVINNKQAGKIARKKAVIACVRLLAIDLWRLFTGKATLGQLGFTG